MKTLLKVLIAGVGLLVLLVVIGVVVLLNFKDSWIASAIERSGTKTLGVETTVDSATLGITDGTFSMAGLTIANPEGYGSAHFMAVPDAGVDVALDTVSADVIEVPELKVGKIDAILDGTGGTPNYKVILDNMKKDEDDAAPPSDDEGPQFVIRSLVLEGATVRVTGFPGMAQLSGDVDIDVPRIELKDVGSAEPMTAGEVMSLVIKTVLATTIENGGGVLPADMIGNLQSRLATMAGLDELGITAIGDVGALGDELRKKADEKIDEVKDEVGKKAKDALGNLLGGGGDKDEEEDDGQP